nr:MAG TPA: hypothetical protein [Caudoviricetes sp.]
MKTAFKNHYYSFVNYVDIFKVICFEDSLIFLQNLYKINSNSLLSFLIQPHFQRYKLLALTKKTI